MRRNCVSFVPKVAWALLGGVCGAMLVAPQGAEGRAAVQRTVVVAALPAVDGSEDLPPARISVGAALDLEGAPVMLRAVAPTPSFAGILSGLRPLPQMRMTSGFGLRMDPIFMTLRMHSGLDLAAPRGTPVPATGAGIVTAAGWMGGYGNCVIVNHGNGIETRYGHLSAIDVSQGQRVAQGEVLGLVGSTGHSTGNHLHYEIRRAGQPVDPSLRGSRRPLQARF